MSEQLAAITLVMREFADGAYDHLSLTRNEARALLEERDRIATRNAKLEALAAKLDPELIEHTADNLAEVQHPLFNEQVVAESWREIDRLAREAQEGKSAT